MDKLCMKFLALNVDFDNPSLDFLGSRKPAHKGIKEWYPRISPLLILLLLASLSWKQLEIDCQFANRNCYRRSRVSWARAQISC